MGRAASLPTLPEESFDELPQTGAAWTLVRDTLPEPPSWSLSERSAAVDDVVLDTPVGEVIRLATVLDKDEPISIAVQLLTLGGARLVVVVDRGRRPVGVLTAQQVLGAMRRLSNQELETEPVLGIACAPAVVSARTPLRGALHWFAVEDRDFLIVAHSDGRLAGVLLASDLPQTLRLIGGRR